MPEPKVGPPRSLSPSQFRRAITGLVDFLTDLDDEVRRESLVAARRALRPPLLDPVLDGLVDRLRHESPGMRRRAAEALVGLGPPAVWPAVRELVRRRNLLVRVRLVEVLAGLGPVLAPRPRQELVQVLDQMAAGDRSGLLARACDAATALLRQGQPIANSPAAGADAMQTTSVSRSAAVEDGPGPGVTKNHHPATE
jgi:HEAT repeat protein